MKTYKTRQREIILSLFEKYPDKCFSAKDIIENCDINVGQATVYRTLTRLSEEDLLRRFRTDGGCDYYKLACHRSGTCHMHIVCRKCGDMIHSDCEFIDEMARHLLDAHGFQLDTSRTVIYGICRDCTGENK